MNKTNILEQQFTELLSYIENKRSEASQAVNEKQLCTAWVVGGYVSAKLKSEEWGSKDAQIVQTVAGQNADIHHRAEEDRMLRETLRRAFNRQSSLS